MRFPAPNVFASMPRLFTFAAPGDMVMAVPAAVETVTGLPAWLPSTRMPHWVAAIEPVPVRAILVGPVVSRKLKTAMPFCIGAAAEPMRASVATLTLVAARLLTSSELTRMPPPGTPLALEMTELPVITRLTLESWAEMAMPTPTSASGRIVNVPPWKKASMVRTGALGSVPSGVTPWLSETALRPVKLPVTGAAAEPDEDVAQVPGEEVQGDRLVGGRDAAIAGVGEVPAVAPQLKPALERG